MPTYRAKIEKCDDGLLLCMPEEAARLHGFKEGLEIELSVSESAIVLRPVRNSTVADLFSGKTDAEWRALYRECDFDWGPDVGREIIDD